MGYSSRMRGKQTTWERKGALQPRAPNELHPDNHTCQLLVTSELQTLAYAVLSHTRTLQAFKLFLLAPS